MTIYYNIHTHKNDEPNCLSIHNIYAAFEQVTSEKNYSAGLHPWHLNDYESQFSILTQIATRKEILAIGECGLDKLTQTPFDLQTAVFIKHIHLANTLQKPLIIHCVQSHEEILQLFKTYKSTVPVIFHGYNKKVSIAEKILINGCYLSFGAALLYENSPAVNTLKEMPANRIFLETDDSEVSITDIYHKAAQIRNTTVDSLILQIHENFKDVFKNDDRY